MRTDKVHHELLSVDCHDAFLDGGAVRPDRLRLLALSHCFAWSTEQLAALHVEADDPDRAAHAFARRLERRQLLNSAVVDCQQVAIADQPLCTSRCAACDVHRIAYQLEQRFSGESKPIRVHWPSPEFARQFGSWTGSKRYPAPQKASHDLIVTWVWLRLLKAAPHVALNAWRSERCLQALAGQRGEAGPKPDAAIVRGGEVRVAIEIGGNYSAAWLRHHIDRFEQAGWEWEIW